MVTDVISTVFGGVWDMLLGVKVPGLDVSFAAFFIALFLIRFSIWLFHFVSGLGGMSSADYGRAANLSARAKVAYQRNERRKIGID